MWFPCGRRCLKRARTALKLKDPLSPPVIEFAELLSTQFENEGDDFICEKRPCFVEGVAARTGLRRICPSPVAMRFSILDEVGEVEFDVWVDANVHKIFFRRHISFDFLYAKLHEASPQCLTESMPIWDQNHEGRALELVGDGLLHQSSDVHFVHSFCPVLKPLTNISATTMKFGNHRVCHMDPQRLSEG